MHFNKLIRGETTVKHELRGQGQGKAILSDRSPLKRGSINIQF
jgi:predicted GNAT family acetyltransferase